MADPATAEMDKQESKAQERIKELDRRNKELEKLVNMDKRIAAAEDSASAAIRMANQANQPKAAPADDGGWTPFLSPKIDPIIEEKLAPLKQAIFRLADDNDRLRTIITTPKYKDPEIEAEVETIRQERLKNSGVLEPRANIITYMKGQNPDRFVEEESSRKQSGGDHVETAAGVGGPRAESRAETRYAEDMTAEEIEKWCVENNYKIP